MSLGVLVFAASVAQAAAPPAPVGSSDAVAAIVEQFRCRGTCDDARLEAAGTLLAGMGDVAAEAAEPLGQIAADESRTIDERRRALVALGLLSDRGRGALAAVVPLTRGERPQDLRESARHAVVQMGGEDAIEVMAAALAEPEGRVYVLRDIASHHEESRGAGPYVEALLDDDDPEVRVAAGRTLGSIGYAESAPALTAALEDPADWRMAYVAAESLGRLRAAGAREALEATASRHWYPPVRGAALSALALLDGRKPSPAQLQARHSNWDFFDLDQIPGAHGSCDATRSSPVVRRTERRFRSTEDPALAKRLTYDVPARNRTGPFVPAVGLRVAGGWLLGSDDGEFGGELVFRSDAGRVSMIQTENVADLQVVGRDTIVAVTGLAHLVSDSGAVYRVERDDKGAWRAIWWRALPGAPETSWPIAGNQLLIVARGGTVVLSPDGTMALAPCHSGIKD